MKALLALPLLIVLAACGADGPPLTPEPGERFGGSDQSVEDVADA